MHTAPLSPSEIARRAEVAMAARVNGAAHQDEPALVVGRVAFDPAPEPIPAPAASVAIPPVADFAEAAPIDTWLCDDHGLARWRPVMDRLDVIPLPGGQSVLVLPNGFRMKFDRQVSKHLSRLLDPDNRRRPVPEEAG